MGPTEVINSGSTHNFVDLKLVRRSNLLVEQFGQLKIMMADGGSLTTKGLCRAVSWEA